MDKSNKKINLVITGLYIGEGSFGGINNFVIFLLKNIDNASFNTKYYSTGISPKYYIGKKHITIYTYYIEIILKIFLFPIFLIRNKIEVVHINSGLSQLSLMRDGIFAIIAKLLRRKTLYILHGWKEKELLQIQNSRIKSWLFKSLLLFQDKVGVSSINYKEILERFGISLNKIFVFSTMVDCDLFDGSFENKNKQITLLFSAHPIVKEKGIVEFLNSIPLIREKFSSFRIIVMGGGKNLEKFINIAKELNIFDHIDFVGYVSFEKKIEIFKTSHILVFPSYTEGFPSTVLEAMASRMAIITTPVGGLVNAIVDKENGLIIRSMPPDNFEIATRVNELLSNHLLLRKMMDKNYAEVREKYSVKNITGQFSEKYKDVIKCYNSHKN